VASSRLPLSVRQRGQGGGARADLQLGVDKYEVGSGYGTSPSRSTMPTRRAMRRAAKGARCCARRADVARPTVIAFIEDPDGYPIEFIQKGTAGWVKEWAE